MFRVRDAIEIRFAVRSATTTGFVRRLAIDVP